MKCKKFIKLTRENNYGCVYRKLNNAHILWGKDV